MEVIRELNGYREFANARFRWKPSSVEFDFPLGSGTICGSCQKGFKSTEYLFLMCTVCLGKKVQHTERSRTFAAVVYGLYSEDNRLLYVGVTKNPISRVHSHMLDKNFQTMRVIRYFNSREEADDFEKYSIYRLRPPMNRLFEKDWTSVPKSWSAKEFGKVGSRPKKRPASKGPRKPLPLCHKCSSPVGRKNMSMEDGNTFHKKCSPSGVILMNGLIERRRKEKEARMAEWAERKREIREHNAKIQQASKVRRNSPPESVQTEALPTVNCVYCQKPVNQGRHIPCRKRRLKELGRL